MPTQTFRRWGNSLAVRIPAEIIEAGHFREGQQIDVQVIDGAITMRPRRQVHEFSMERYLKQLEEGAPEIAPTLDWGPPQGSEPGGPDDPIPPGEW